jgi:DNA (cytosine-5)-methyltransferase 1
MRFGSVCSGIEAASVAWEPLGWRPSFYSEIAKFPRAVLAHHYPEVPLHGDFTTIEAGRYDPIDLLVGGTPCQSFSVAGLRAGLDDDRGNLALEFCRLARRLGPRWVIWENVPGVLSLDGGRAFGSILGGLAECGYGLSYRVLDAQYARVDGYARAVPQRRNRVFVVGYLGDWRRAAAVLFEPESLRGNPPSRGAPWEGASADISQSLRAQSQSSHRADSEDFTVGRWSPDIARCVTAGYAQRFDLESEDFVAHAFDARQSDVVQYGDVTGPIDTDGTSIGVMTARSVALRGRDGGGTIELGDDVAGTVRASQGGGDKPHVLTAAWGIGPDAVDRSGEASNGSAAGRSGLNITDGFQPALRARSTNSVATPSAVRRLTPRECERLQGFPDDYTAVPYRGKPAADGPRYEALGNSFPVNVVRWIGQRIQMVEDVPL